MRSKDGVDVSNRIPLLQLSTNAVAYPVDFVRLGFLFVTTRTSTHQYHQGLCDLYMCLTC